MKLKTDPFRWESELFEPNAGGCVQNHDPISAECGYGFKLLLAVCVVPDPFLRFSSVILTQLRCISFMRGGLHKWEKERSRL